MSTNTLPKSLHTVSVLVAVAQRLIINEGLSAAIAVSETLSVLGYTNTPDTYGLAQQALKKLNKATQS